jgi:hypothetical protein
MQTTRKTVLSVIERDGAHVFPGIGDLIVDYMKCSCQPKPVIDIRSYWKKLTFNEKLTDVFISISIILFAFISHLVGAISLFCHEYWWLGLVALLFWFYRVGGQIVVLFYRKIWTTHSYIRDCKCCTFRESCFCCFHCSAAFCKRCMNKLHKHGGLVFIGPTIFDQAWMDRWVCNDCCQTGKSLWNYGLQDGDSKSECVLLIGKKENL